MFKLFGVIRHKLLVENKFNRYLVYALGEVLLVVIGILIALQISTWNQNRIDSKLERRLFLAIGEKMELNTFQFERGTKRYTAVIDAARNLIVASNDTSINLNNSEVEQYLSTLTKRFLFGKSNETSIYDEMIGSGQLSILKSEKLRSKLTGLKANM
ncbi:MAG: hypothetical protein ACJA01_004508 [Saprospiraceae bacterium]|jgi:hypothetical protein